ncbi:HEPN domain-containing protein [uncultured Sphingomonas sp.]|uniref:HEPN domain-containing protein n=1 Tax=uncultured Sphingomonas sp. TaxID=158754 RepID=UPI0025CD810F|nr:HEPN domain-containing protein [uncultured Sphingomonas sp.]
MANQLDRELGTFRRDIQKNALFLEIEKKIRNPASVRSRPRSETLLSAFVTLSCGRFEDYLKRSFAVSAQMLSARIPQSDDARLGANFHWNNMNGFITWSSRAKNVDRVDMMTYIENFSAAVVSKNIFPLSFQNTSANPNSATIKNMFNAFGVSDPFAKLSSSYLDSKNRTFSKLLLEQNVDRFIKRRNQAAHHTAELLEPLGQISRTITSLCLGWRLR